MPDPRAGAEADGGADQSPGKSEGDTDSSKSDESSVSDAQDGDRMSLPELLRDDAAAANEAQRDNQGGLLFESGSLHSEGSTVESVARATIQGNAQRRRHEPSSATEDTESSHYEDDMDTLGLRRGDEPRRGGTGGAGSTVSPLTAATALLHEAKESSVGGGKTEGEEGGEQEENTERDGDRKSPPELLRDDAAAANEAQRRVQRAARRITDTTNMKGDVVHEIGHFHSEGPNVESAARGEIQGNAQSQPTAATEDTEVAYNDTGSSHYEDDTDTLGLRHDDEPRPGGIGDDGSTVSALTAPTVLRREVTGSTVSALTAPTVWRREATRTSVEGEIREEAEEGKITGEEEMEDKANTDKLPPSQKPNQKTDSDVTNAPGNGDSGSNANQVSRSHAGTTQSGNRSNITVRPGAFPVRPSGFLPEDSTASTGESQQPVSEEGVIHADSQRLEDSRQIATEAYLVEEGQETLTAKVIHTYCGFERKSLFTILFLSLIVIGIVLGVLLPIVMKKRNNESEATCGPLCGDSEIPDGGRLVLKKECNTWNSNSVGTPVPEEDAELSILDGNAPTCNDLYQSAIYGCGCPGAELPPSRGCGSLCRDGSPIPDPELSVRDINNIEYTCRGKCNTYLSPSFALIIPIIHAIYV